MVKTAAGQRAAANPPTRVAVASSDRVYASSLEELLTAAGMIVRRLPQPPDRSSPETDADWTDVLLVEIHGLESAEWRLLERVRRGQPLVEIVAISSDPVVEDAVCALRAGVFAVLQYPVSREELADTITRAAARKRRAERRLRELDDDRRCRLNGGVARPARRRRTDAEKHGGGMDETTTLKVLLVDDEEEFLHATEKVLRRRGMEVLTARNGAEGLATLEREPVDVVVLDVRMPGMDGDEVFRRVKERRPGVPVIILTGHGTLPQAFELSKGGVFDYLPKPCDVDRLAARIREAAAARGVVASVPEPTGTPPDEISVLVVDDEVELLAALERVLARRGMRVATASSGEAALEHLAGHDADVVVLDVKMPGIDGLETLQRIKRQRPDRRVILLTGHPKLENATAGIRLGAMEYLTKPPDVERLCELIRAAWGERRRATEAERQATLRSILERQPE